MIYPGEYPTSANNSCAYVRGGVLSELVAFSDNLFANVAGPSEDVSTLFKVLSVPGDIITNKGGWRDSSFFKTILNKNKLSTQTLSA